MASRGAELIPTFRWMARSNRFRSAASRVGFCCFVMPCRRGSGSTTAMRLGCASPKRRRARRQTTASACTAAGLTVILQHHSGKIEMHRDRNEHAVNAGRAPGTAAASRVQSSSARPPGRLPSACPCGSQWRAPARPSLPLRSVAAPAGSPAAAHASVGSSNTDRVECRAVVFRAHESIASTHPSASCCPQSGHACSPISTCRPSAR